jgi:steroid 5-alpha reductase family enzyme
MFHAALDPYYLGLTGILTVAWQALGFFLVFYIIKSDNLTDCWSAINFLFLALITLTIGAADNARNILASIFVVIWAVRLGGFQIFRVTKMGGDTRFDDMRGKFLNFAGFWLAQAVWVWTVSCECPFPQGRVQRQTRATTSWADASSSSSIRAQYRRPS